VPIPRRTLAVLSAGAVGLAAAPAAAAARTTPPCVPPKQHFVACLRVLYRQAEGDAVAKVRVTATLLRRVDVCPARSARRTFVLTRDGAELARVRRAGRCRAGVVTWRARFPTGRTRVWRLEPGQRVQGSWSGVRATNRVRIEPEATTG
jgi:hypothetical protein